jgi:hypothetical protein
MIDDEGERVVVAPGTRDLLIEHVVLRLVSD